MDYNQVSGSTGATPENASPAATGDAPILSSIDLLGDVLQTPDVEIVKFNKDGSVKKKPGRKPGQQNATVSRETIARPAKTAIQKKADLLTAEQTAKMFINMAIGLAVNVIGDEWNFDSQEEADTMKTVVTAYIDAKGNGQLSPETMLAIALVGFSASRMRHENTQAKIGKFFGKLWTGAKKLFIK